MRSTLFVLVLGLACLIEAAASDAKTQARLLVGAATARPGDTVLAGIHLTLAEGWHIYWRNPGESGTPTAVEWILPPGVTAGELQWPPPARFVADDLTTYGYEHETMLLAPLTLTSNLPPGALELKARVSWLECEVACVPGDATLSTRIEVGPENRPTPALAQLQAWQGRMPKPGPAPAVQTKAGGPLAGEKAVIVLSGATSDDLVPDDFYAYPSEAAEVLPAVKVLGAAAGQYRIEKTVQRLGARFPDKLAGILVQPGTDGAPPRATEVVLALPGGAPPNPAGTITNAAPPAALNQGAGESAPTPPPRPVPEPSATATPTGGIGLFWKMLGLAFLGGLILNVMPCVLPVIALKILGFVQQSREAPAEVRRLGLLYALGVVASFLVLAAVVLAVRAAGEAASWGMQMQNLYFRTALTAVVTLVALNLFGLFEVTLGGGAMGAAANLAAREGGWGAFFNGVLATALATPCTAPFLTVALGFAFTQPAAVVVILFVVTALGLALPYVVLSWQPGWLKFLPKPGGWMVKFKVAMGFPMLATAIWLFDLTAPSYGEGGVLWLGLFLVLLALAAWIWGEFVQRARAGRAWAGTLAIGLVGLGYGLALEGQLDWRHPAPPSAAGDVVRDSADGLEWHRWSPAAVEQARAAGRPVLVDFTARWCLTCKTNKRIAIDIPSVRARLREINAVAFRADYTDKDPRIAAELQRYRRAGVPLVLVFPRRADAPPEILPAALTPGIVLDALNKAAG
jgi:thiol:disulfide interchange protein DsbD